MELKKKHEPFDSKEKVLYKIGMFAAMNRVTVKTLRFYEEQGLLMPAYINEENGYRYYTLGQMEQVHQISALKQAGFTLDDIAKINAGSDEESLIIRKKSELMERAGCECRLPEYCFTNYPEPAYDLDEITVETCEAVVEARQELDGLSFKLMPEIEAACIFHRGSYADLVESYEILLKYIEDNNYKIAGPIRESYIDGVWNKEDESQWLTELQIPVILDSSN